MDGMSNNKIDQSSNEPVVASLVAKTIQRKYPESFFHTVADIKIPRLDKYQTAALIEYMNITDTVAYDKLNRFFRQQYQTDLLCPKRVLSEM